MRGYVCNEDVFNSDFFKRLAFIALVPNVLVWGFNEIGIATDRHPLWRYLVGPYWHAEVFLVKFTLFCAVAFCVWQVGAVLLPPLSEWLRERLSESHHENEELRLQNIQEERSRECQAMVSREKARFEALPQAEREQIIQEREERALARKQEQQREYEEFERIKREKAAQIEAEALRQQAILNSAEGKRKRALRDFTGGGL